MCVDDNKTCVFDLISSEIKDESSLFLDINLYYWQYTTKVVKGVQKTKLSVDLSRQ